MKFSISEFATTSVKSHQPNATQSNSKENQMTFINLAIQTEFKLDGFVIHMISIEADIETTLDWAWEIAPLPINEEFTYEHTCEAIDSINNVLLDHGYVTVFPLTFGDLNIDGADVQITEKNHVMPPVPQHV
jgi:hypothetical protein